MRWIFSSLLAVALLTGCRTAPRPDSLSRYEFEEPHMGTLWRITLYAPDQPSAALAARSAFARVAALDAILTDYEPTSELMRLRDSPPGAPVRVSKDLFEILRLSQRLAVASQGAFDVTCGPVVQLWRRARRQRELPAPERLAKARQAVGYQKLKLDAGRRTVTFLEPGMRLDVGGIAKGFAADEALRVLRSLGMERALVAASGDLAIGDAPPGKAGWRVAIGAPGSTNLAALLLLSRAGVSTSGDTEQHVDLGGVRYSHIIDPRTGCALTNRLQVTVVADCTTRSDALATTLCVLGAEEGLKFIEHQRRASACMLIPQSGTNYVTLKSRQFPALQKRD